MELVLRIMITGKHISGSPIDFLPFHNFTSSSPHHYIAPHKERNSRHVSREESLPTSPSLSSILRRHTLSNIANLFFIPNIPTASQIHWISTDNHPNGISYFSLGTPDAMWLRWNFTFISQS